MTYSGGQRSSRKAPTPSGFGPLGALFQYLGSEKASQDYTNLLRGNFPSVGRAASAADEMQGPTREVYEQPGVGFFDRSSGRFLGKAPSAPALPTPGQAPGMGVTPIIRNEDDQYRQLLSQYGALSKAGKQEEAEKLGMEIWQKKYGKTPMGQPGGAIGTDNPLMRSMREMFPERYSQEAAFNVPQGFDVSSGFSMAANAVPAPWNTQGQAVSAPYQEAMNKAFEKTNPMNLLSQQPVELGEDIGSKVRAFLAERK